MMDSQQLSDLIVKYLETPADLPGDILAVARQFPPEESVRAQLDAYNQRKKSEVERQAEAQAEAERRELELIQIRGRLLPETKQKELAELQSIVKALEREERRGPLTRNRRQQLQRTKKKLDELLDFGHKQRQARELTTEENSRLESLGDRSILGISNAERKRLCSELNTLKAVVERIVQMNRGDLLWSMMIPVPDAIKEVTSWPIGAAQALRELEGYLEPFTTLILTQQKRKAPTQEEAAGDGQEYAAPGDPVPERFNFGPLRGTQAAIIRAITGKTTSTSKELRTKHRHHVVFVVLVTRKRVEVYFRSERDYSAARDRMEQS